MNNLEVKELSVFAGTKKILNNLSFTATGGMLVSILGGNGAGKTSLLKALAGHINYEGKIFINNRELKTLSSIERASGIAYLPQLPEITSNISVEQIIAMGRYHASRNNFNNNDYIIIKNSAEVTNTSNLLNRNIKTLSGGERQRVLLASALAQEPQILLLDEPLSFMDPAFSSEFSKIIRSLCSQKNLLILQVSHDLNTCLPISDKVLAIKESEIFYSGTPKEFIESGAFQKSYNHAFINYKIPERDFPILLNE